jgi:hypothetical protein
MIPPLKHELRAMVPKQSGTPGLGGGGVRRYAMSKQSGPTMSELRSPGPPPVPTTSVSRR